MQAPAAGVPEESGTPAVAGEELPPPRKPGSARFLFGATILILEVFVILFGALVIFGLDLVPTVPLLVASLVLAGLCVAATGLLRKGDVGWILGTVAQVLLIVSGLVLPMMTLVGIIFAALWVAAYVLGSRIDVERQERFHAEVELWAQRTGVR